MREICRIRPLNNERGVALILAIGMVAVVSILAVVVNTGTNRELRSSGRFQNKFAAFYMADRAVEYSLNRDILLSLTEDETTDLTTPVHYNSIKFDSDNADLGYGVVADEGPGSLPAHLAGKYGTDFGANLYHVSTRASGPDNRESHVDSQIVRLFKLDDDTILRTSGDE